MGRTCPKCGGEMERERDKWVCQCGHEIVNRIAQYMREDIKREIEELLNKPRNVRVIKIH